jgi:bifunctional DNase/RNase
MTHDLLKDIIDQLGGRVIKVVVTSLKESTFLANIEIASGDALHIIDARPSDAIALAVRTSCPLVVAAQVLEQAQVTLVAVNPTGNEEDIEFKPVDESGQTGTNFANIEKEKWAEILAEMDPEDFKYKM